MVFVLKHAVIHSFDKKMHEAEVKNVVKKDALIPTEHEPIKKLVSTLSTLLGRKENSVVWGQFSNTGREGPIPEEVTEFSKLQDPDEAAANFLTLSHSIIDQLVEQASGQALATGGHVLTALYESSFGAMQHTFLMVASIKERAGLALDGNYIPQEATDIDLSKLNQAAKINITRLLESAGAPVQDAGNVGDVEDAPDMTYLCFINPVRGREASRYFVEALGCEKGIASGRATDRALSLVFDFFKERNALKKYRSDAKQKVVDYLSDCLAGDTLASIDGICLAAISAVPPAEEEAVTATEELLPWLNSEEARLPSEFPVSQKVLDKNLKIKGTSLRDNWKISFEKGALGDENSDIFYNAAQEKLVLSNLDQALKRKIQAALSERTN